MTWPDVLRLVSVVGDPRTVTFRVSGPMSAFVTAVRLGNGTSGVLAGRVTQSVSVDLSVSGHTRPGRYAGTLTVHVSGWATDARLCMIVCVCEKGPSQSHRKERRGPTSYTARPGAPTPSPTTTPVTPTASSSPKPSAPTPVATSTPAVPTSSVTPSPTPAVTGGAGANGG